MFAYIIWYTFLHVAFYHRVKAVPDTPLYMEAWWSKFQYNDYKVKMLNGSYVGPKDVSFKNNYIYCFLFCRIISAIPVLISYFCYVFLSYRKQLLKVWTPLFMITKTIALETSCTTIFWAGERENFMFLRSALCFSMALISVQAFIFHTRICLKQEAHFIPHMQHSILQWAMAQESTTGKTLTSS